MIRYGSGDVELYDMKADARQFTNLAKADEQQTTLKELSAKLEAKLQAMK
jgi:hypothetical protein